MYTIYEFDEQRDIGEKKGRTNIYLLGGINRDDAKKSHRSNIRNKINLPPCFEHECPVCERKANFSQPYADGARDDVWPGVHYYGL